MVPPGLVAESTELTGRRRRPISHAGFCRLPEVLRAFLYRRGRQREDSAALRWVQPGWAAGGRAARRPGGLLQGATKGKDYPMGLRHAMARGGRSLILMAGAGAACLLGLAG